MKIYFLLLMAAALAFLLFMHGIHGLRTEKVLREGETWQEIHIVWDWNKVMAWSRQYRSSGEQEPESTEPEGTSPGRTEPMR